MKKDFKGEYICCANCVHNFAKDWIKHCWSIQKLNFYNKYECEEKFSFEEWFNYINNIKREKNESAHNKKRM